MKTSIDHYLNSLYLPIPKDLLGSYSNYRDSLFRSRINILYIFGLTLIPVAFFFDVLIFPDQSKLLGITRCISTLTCIVFYLLYNKSRLYNFPIFIPHILNVIVATTIAALTYITGGIESPYYAGQILIYICMSMFMPFGVGESFLASITIIIIHYGINLFPVFIWKKDISWPSIWNSIYFLSFSFGMVLIASVMLENYRRKLFVGAELEKIKNARLEDSNKKIDALLKTKNIFLANITHELKTPLSIVIGNAELIMEKSVELDSSINDNLKIIQQAAFQLATHVDRLIAVTKADDPEIKLVTDKYDYVGVVRNLLSLFDNRAVAEGVELRLKCTDKPLVASIDIYRIEEILSNLIQNAFKFTPRGGSITLTVGSDGQYIVTEVHDTGKGISEDQLPHIFERLYQADDVLSKQHGGIGIGLYLCKRNVELHGGTIQAYSRINHGTTFRFTLPLYFDQSADVKNLPYTGPERRRDDRRRTGPERRILERKKKYEFQLTLGLEDLAAITHVENIRDFENRNPAFPSILIVEDNLGMMKVMVDGLGDEFNLFLAFTGYEGLEKLKSHQDEIALILTDIMMPGMSGYDFCHHVRQTEEWRHIPLIFVTALLKEEDQLRGYELGATDFIIKPYNLRILKEKVSHWISRRQYELLLRGMSSSLETRLNAVSKMKSIVVHEIRNPLQVISGAGSLLEIIRNSMPPEAVGQTQQLSEYLKLLRHGIDSLRGVIESTNKIDDDFISNRCAEPVKALFNDALVQTNNLLGATRIELDLEAVGDAHVFCNRRLMTQVFVNVIRNATEAIAERNPTEGGLIKIQARQTSPEQVSLSFRDNGAGMSQEVKRSLFNFKFTTKRDGTGVGLHFSKMIIKLHDGQIQVDSIVGVGTEFQITLPTHPFPAVSMTALAAPASG